MRKKTMPNATEAHDWEWWRDFEARQEIRKWSELDPEYAEMIQDLRDALAYISRTRDPHEGGKRNILMDDESHVAAANVSLGMGTRMLPSNRYR